MTLNWLVFMALGPSPTPPGTAPDPRGQMLQTFGLLAMMLFLMYFVLFRPQRQRQKQLETLLKSIKSGDKILTASGIVGVVISVKEKTISIRSADSKLEILKSTISEITEKAGDAAVAAQS